MKNISFVIVIIFVTISLLSNYNNIFVLAKEFNNIQNEHRNRLLIDEMSFLKEKIDDIIDSIDDKNYTLTSKAINNIKSSTDWINIKTELDLRNSNTAINFKNLLSKIEESIKNKNYIANEQIVQLSKNYDEIVQTLSKPIIDMFRLVLTLIVIFLILGFGIYIIPTLRRKLHIKY